MDHQVVSELSALHGLHHVYLQTKGGGKIVERPSTGVPFSGSLTEPWTRLDAPSLFATCWELPLSSEPHATYLRGP